MILKPKNKPLLLTGVLLHIGTGGDRASESTEVSGGMVPRQPDLECCVNHILPEIGRETDVASGLDKSPIML